MLFPAVDEFVGGARGEFVRVGEGEFFRERLEAQKGYLEDIGERFGRLRRIVRLPLLRTDVQGMDQIKKIAEWIGEIDA